MQKRITFGRWEAVTLLINLICTKLFLSYARMTAEDSGTAGWIMSIFTCILVLLIYIALSRLAGRFEGKDLLDIAAIAGGGPLKAVTGFVLTGLFFYSTFTVMREFTEDMKIISLPSSPLSFVMLFFIIGVLAGSFLGAEAIVRLCAIVVPVIAAGYVAILLGAIPYMDYTNLFPILGTGLNDIITKGVFRVSVFSELLVIFLLPPFMGDSKKVRNTGFAALAFSSPFLVLGSFVYILTFNYPSNLEPFLPIYQMARLINLGRFFQRVESLFVFIWAMAALLYMTATFYLTVYVAAKTAGLKYIRPIILPFAIIVFSAAFLPANLITAIKIDTEIINKFVGLGAFAFAALVLASANVKRRKKERIG